MEFYYISSNGNKLDLVRWPYRIQTSDILDAEYQYEYSTGTLPKIERFYKDIRTSTVTLTIKAKSREEFYKAIDHFFEVTETDVRNLSPGKLYFGDQYLSCYFAGSKKAEWENNIGECDIDLTLISPATDWITEQKYSFPVNESTQGTYLNHPFNYPYNYTLDVRSQREFYNDHYSTCDFLMYIYGPCTNPRISINETVVYEVVTDILAGEYLSIDSKKREIVKVLNDGTQINEFNNRNKTYGFGKIPPSNNYITLNGNFGMDLVIYQERSEPKWT